MNRTTTAMLTALEAVIVVAVGVLVPLVPAIILWAVHFGFGAELVDFWRGAVDVWLLGHGVPIHIGLDAATTARLGADSELGVFVLSVPPLLFAGFTAVMGARIGRRTGGGQWQTVLPAGVIAVGAVSGLLAVSANVTGAGPRLVPAIIVPALIFGAGIIAGVVRRAVVVDDVEPGPLFGRVLGAAENLPRAAGTIALAAVRGAGVALLGMIALSAVVFGVVVIGHFGTIVGLYETAQLGVLGGVAVTIAQIAFVPTMILWVLGWIAGPGFAFGAGSSISPVATDIGPVPTIPILGALPTGTLTFGLVAVLLIVFAGVAAGRYAAPALAGELGRAPTARDAVFLCLGIAAIGGIVVGLATWWAHGSIGPGRLADVGGNGAIIGLCVAAELLVGAAIGYTSVRAGRGVTGRTSAR